MRGPWAVPHGSFLLPDSVKFTDTTRNSANDATDDDNQFLFSFVTPANFLKPGDVFEVLGFWEYSLSATNKIFGVQDSFGQGYVGFTVTTPNVATVTRIPVHIINNTTAYVLNTAQPGVGTGDILTRTIDVGVAITWNYFCRWGSQPVAGEFIRLKQAAFLFSRGF